MTGNAATRNRESTLGQRINEARKQAGFTVTRLARALDVDTRTVTRWQADEAMPSVVRLGQIAQVLGRPTSYFLDSGGAEA